MHKKQGLAGPSNQGYSFTQVLNLEKHPRKQSISRYEKKPGPQKQPSKKQSLKIDTADQQYRQAIRKLDHTQGSAALKTRDVYSSSEYRDIAKNYSATDIEPPLKVEEYMAQATKQGQDFGSDEETQLPGFLGRMSVGAQNKGHFYMTQIINQQYQTQDKGTQLKKTLQAGSKYQKKKSINQSQLQKSQQKSQVSPLQGGGRQQESSKDSRNKKRASLNSSAIYFSQAKEYMNATAPINFNQVGQGSENTRKLSVHDLQRIASKDSQKAFKQSQHYQNYMNGVKPPQIQSVKSSLSPAKYTFNNFEGKSEVPSSSQFLNLALKQLIKQQKVNQQTPRKQTIDQPTVLLKNKNMIPRGSDSSSSSQMMGISRRLNKTVVDNLSTKQHQQPPKAHRNLNATQVNNYIDFQIANRTKDESQKYSKFSNTMKMSDFNQTQVFDMRLNSQPKSKHSKASLKSTQLINFTEDQHQVRKPSTMSTYSVKTAASTKHGTTKRKSIVNAKVGIQGLQQHNSRKSNQKRKGSRGHQDKSLINTILNIYQNEVVLNEEPKIAQPKIQLPLKSKHKGNATLATYLKQDPSNKSKEEASKGQVHSPVIMNDERVSKATIPQKSSKLNITTLPYQQDLTPIMFQQNLGPSYQSRQGKKHVKELQNKTQPLPKMLIDIARADADNLSATSIEDRSTGSHYQHHLQSNLNKSRQPALPTDSTNHPSQYKPKIGKRKDIEIAKNVPKTQEQGEAYKEKPPTILESLDGESIQDSPSKSKLEKFILGKQIGQGAYAVVRVATCKKDNKQYAIKIYDKSKLTDTNRQRSVRREIKLLQKMNHSTIVKIYDAFETEHHVYLVMEYVSGGSLHSYLKERSDRRLEEGEAKRIFKQLMTALKYCHKKSIAHRDIKLENILLDDDKNVKIIDFGFSTCIPNDKKIKMFCGTPSYMAPEIVGKTEYAGPPADIWASAVLLYALLNGCFPFRGATDKDLYRRIQRGTFIMQNTKVSKDLLNLLSTMLNTEADERPSAEDILENVWFQREGPPPSSTGDEEERKLKVAEAKRQFKDKILSTKAPVEKKINTLCLLPSGSSNDRATLSPQAAKTSTGLPQNSGNNPNLALNLDFSDYGLNQPTMMRKLNHEAYQAYYNTSGSGGQGLQQNQLPQTNPYFNNYFQPNFMSNMPQPNLQFYPGYQHSNIRISPHRNTTTGYPFVNGINPIGTPQVFGSPSGFQCSAGVISNNFNIVNNITQVTCAPSHSHLKVPSSPHYQINPSDATQGDQQRQNDKTICSDFDDEIVNSITKLGYQRSQVITELEMETSHISHLYHKLQEEKSSLTKGRAQSQQPQYRRQGGHNQGVFPNSVSSIPEGVKTGSDKTRNTTTCIQQVRID